MIFALDKTLETTHVGLTSLIGYMQRRKELINYSKKLLLSSFVSFLSYHIFWGSIWVDGST
jgi:hypothetical protein